MMIKYMVKNHLLHPVHRLVINVDQINSIAVVKGIIYINDKDPKAEETI